MMNITKNLALFSLTCSALVIVACNKVIDVGPAPAPPVVREKINSLFDDAMANASQTFTQRVDTDFVIIGAQGTEVAFDAYSFKTAAGDTVKGTVNIELIEIYNKADMILLNKPTMGINAGKTEPLISGGQFYLNYTQNGVAVKLAKQAVLSTRDVSSIDPLMKKFVGTPKPDGTVSWQVAANPAPTTCPGDSGLTVSKYCINIDSNFRWINCDYFASYPDPKYGISINLPAEYNDSTAKVFISFDGKMTVANTYFNGTNFSISPNYALPKDLPISFIAIGSDKNNQLHYARLSTTIKMKDQLEKIEQLIPVTQDQLDAFLNSLP